MRGLAELLILQRIFDTMEAVVANELGAAAQPLLPSNFLDLDRWHLNGRVSVPDGATSFATCCLPLTTAVLPVSSRFSLADSGCPISETMATCKDLSQHIFPSQRKLDL